MKNKLTDKDIIEMAYFRLRGMLPSRWFERKPITWLAGR